MTVIDHIRRSLIRNCAKNRNGWDEVWWREWCPEFDKLRHNRMAMGFYRYGSICGYIPKPASRNTDLIRQRTDEYIKTGNMETMLDIANFAMIEWVCGVHPKRHFATVQDRHDANKNK